MYCYGGPHRSIMQQLLNKRGGRQRLYVNRRHYKRRHTRLRNRHSHMLHPSQRLGYTVHVPRKKDADGGGLG